MFRFNTQRDHASIHARQPTSSRAGAALFFGTAVRTQAKSRKAAVPVLCVSLQMKSPRHNLRAPPAVNSANGCVRPPRPRVHRFASIPPDPAPTTNQVPLERDSRKEALLADIPLNFVSRCQPSAGSVRSKSPHLDGSSPRRACPGSQKTWVPICQYFATNFQTSTFHSNWVLFN